MTKLGLKKNKGMTLISLVVTIIILIILVAVTIRLVLGDNGIINKAQIASEETTKEAATEAMNFKITNAQIETYGKEQRMPTLQELADDFCEDEDFEYVELATKKTASLSKIEVGENESIFTKLKEYPYEFEINSSLQLASIDGIQVATSTEDTLKEDNYRAGIITFGDIGAYSSKAIKITFNKPMESDNYAIIITSKEGGTYWASISFTTNTKTSEGFNIIAYNNIKGTAKTISAYWIAIPINN